jgi:hypothetical protein
VTIQKAWIHHYKRMRLTWLFAHSSSVFNWLNNLQFIQSTTHTVSDASYLEYELLTFQNNESVHTLSKLPVYPPYFTGSHMPDYSPWMIDGISISAYQISGTTFERFLSITSEEAKSLQIVFDEFYSFYKKNQLI